MNQRNWFIILTAILVTLLMSSALTAYTPSESLIKPAAAQEYSRAERNWEYVNKDVRASNYNPQTQINADNVHYLELKRMWPFPERSVYEDNLPGLGFQRFEVLVFDCCNCANLAFMRSKSIVITPLLTVHYSFNTLIYII